MLQIGAAAGVARSRGTSCRRAARRGSNRYGARQRNPARRSRTAIIEWTDPLMLAGNWVPEMIEMAGGTCESNAARRAQPGIRMGRTGAIRSGSNRGVPVRIRSCSGPPKKRSYWQHHRGLGRIRGGANGPGVCRRRQRLFQSPRAEIGRQLGTAGWIAAFGAMQMPALGRNCIDRFATPRRPARAWGLRRNNICGRRHC